MACDEFGQPKYSRGTVNRFDGAALQVRIGVFDPPYLLGLQVAPKSGASGKRNPSQFGWKRMIPVRSAVVPHHQKALTGTLQRQWQLVGESDSSLRNTELLRSLMPGDSPHR